jgi:hypothetical protein
MIALLAICLVVSGGFAYTNLGQAVGENSEETEAELETEPEREYAVVWDEEGVFGPTEGLQTLVGDMSVASAGVALQNMVIVGDLYLESSIGHDAAITLNNITITGEIIILGAGSVTLNNCRANRLIVSKEERAVTVVAEGFTTIWSVRIESEAQLEERVAEKGLGFGHVYCATNDSITLSGHFPSLTVEERLGSINVTAGSIGKVYIESKARNAVLSLSNDVTIEVLDLFAAINVKGEGKVELAIILVSGSKMDTAPANYMFEPGTSITVAGQLVDAEFLEAEAKRLAEEEARKAAEAKKAAEAAAAAAAAKKQQQASKPPATSTPAPAPAPAPKVSIQGAQKLVNSPIPAMTSFRITLSNADPNKQYTVTSHGKTFRLKSGGYYEVTVESSDAFAQKTEAEIKSGATVQ